jgi:hypothetical protein
MTAVLFDRSGIETKPGRYGLPVLGCPACGRWSRELILDGRGQPRCWRCQRHHPACGEARLPRRLPAGGAMMQCIA